MRISRLTLRWGFGLLVAALSPAASGEEPAVTLTTSAPSAGVLPLSLSNEVDAAVRRGLDWLAARQKPDGSWSNGDFPALTALPLQAFLRWPSPPRESVVERAVSYVASCSQEDGGIYRPVAGRKGGGLSNYNTAICMTALHAARRPDLVPIVRKARAFIAGTQHFGDDDYRGGFGYDRASNRPYTDLLNTFYAVEAMRLTQDVEDVRPQGVKATDIDWSETVTYITRLQNTAEAGAENAGGFVYNPNDPKAGAATNRTGAVVFRSYGSITYAGLLALIYANVSRDDVRVRSAFDWAARHWSLDENPGMGSEGLYFFYNVLSKSLAAYGQEAIPRKDGAWVNWREDLAQKLVRTQVIDPDTGHGYWLNDTGRFWENDPTLVTAYSLLALEWAAGR